jgi:hypothetical protein
VVGMASWLIIIFGYVVVALAVVHIVGSGNHALLF